MMVQPLISKMTAVGETADVVVLCGGLGTRLQSVFPDRPKVLAPVNGGTFLKILLRSIRRQGFHRIILSVGYRKEVIKKHLKRDPAFIFSEESEPLGTGGAVKRALSLIASEDVIVMNGDTFCPVDLGKLLQAHKQKKAMLTMVLVPQGRSDGGGVVIAPATKLITRFVEKGAAVPSFMNAGIYVMSRAIEKHLPPATAFSLEYDLFPSLIKSVPCFSFVVEETVIDIGTPERYRAAISYFRTRKI